MSASARRATRYAADEIVVEQRRRHRQHARQVVEALLVGLVAGQQHLRIQLQSQQIANRVAVLGAAQAVDGHPAWIGSSRGGRVQRVLEECRGGGQRGRGGTRRAGRRHLAGAQLAHHFLPRLGVRGHVAQVEALDREARGLQSLAVTRDAVAVEDRSRRGWIAHGGRALGSRRLPAATRPAETRTGAAGWRAAPSLSKTRRGDRMDAPVPACAVCNGTPARSDTTASRPIAAAVRLPRAVISFVPGRGILATPRHVAQGWPRRPKFASNTNGVRIAGFPPVICRFCSRPGRPAPAGIRIVASGQLRVRGYPQGRRGTHTTLPVVLRLDCPVPGPILH